MPTDNHQEPQLRINVLGPVECWFGGERVRLGGLVQERVLVALVLEAGQVLSVAQLVDAVWEEESSPATATHQVRKAVARLRQLIPGGAGILVTETSGYRAGLTSDQSDLRQFTAHLAGARTALANRDEESAADHLERALSLWRGEVLAGEGGQLIRGAGAALLERRTAAVEQLINLRLARGESSELVGELRTHVAAHPLRERPRGLLMLALFRSGRQAEALEEFGRVRSLLADELGIDPGNDLAALHERILRNDPDLVVTAPEPPARHPPGPRSEPESRQRVHSLPNDLTDFIGRKQELEILRQRMDAPPTRGPRVLAIDGMGGAGKTSLAVRAAHAVAERYPDAQLYLDLRGFTPAEQPMSAPAAAEALLRMLSVPTGNLPDEPAARIEFWRATITERSVLLLLDNVSDVAQVRPLLPPDSRSLVLITSRTRLIDLDGAHWISLGTMSNEDSTAMATTVLSDQRTAAEPEAVASLIELCGHLPLALRIALSRLANRPRWPIAYLVDRMSDESRRLDELRSDERGVELTLKISYEGLDAHHRASFRLLGLHPGRDLDVSSAAALFGCSEAEAETTLEVLLDAHLLQQHEFGYYAFHDLVRSFVRQILKSSDHADTADVPNALKSLLDYLVHTSDHVCNMVFNGRMRLPTGLSDPPPVPAQLADHKTARAWLARERATLEAAAVLAHEHGFDRHAAHLTRNVVFELDTIGLYTEFAEITRLSVLSSRRLGDRELLHLSLANSAVANWKLGRFETGMLAASEALDIARDLGDKRGFAKGIGMLGLLTAHTGRFDEALPMLQESISIKRDLGVGRAEAESLVNLSSLYEEWGRYPEAVEAANRAVALDDELHIHGQQIIACASLAQAHLGLHAYEEADEQLGVARTLVEEFGAPAGNGALVFALSALTHHRLGRHELSRQYADMALRSHRGHWTTTRQVEIDNIIGRLRRAQGRHADALAHHRSAYEVASAIGYRIAEARALAGLGEAEKALGRTEAAQEHLRRASEGFADMGVPTEARE
ncbi:BTAD domain-containing putative transcriptional regulator [Umezawaea sp. Da 62-37]|uniref:AfsR/SARP family transcriptional regulator n=1 Tax=Umezawaea sp. Da 62-37 TaxID=3075927 RepID=UPI0028F732AB|nr:BTAD domain-containing putative transcriptional regulator [Umezawaea sp. Da 62-37]WNV87663.1 BTAD domain-containing putative transcriptional regulator [Umezawaea sp. Da 62-37]